MPWTAPPAVIRVFAVDDNSWSGSEQLLLILLPAIGTEIGESGPFDLNTWTRVDITLAITGNGVLEFCAQGRRAENVP